ncbi:large conductance mechanosensitive channel protein MscL [Microcella humidisoli]|jgi:large conductance mechanosensitive channel|uniref:Large-conductance mechanosensitive channel n=1 Tax=Microcella humidisoli TaxID=2963406 RepID=A0ABY5FTG7_9MICO|nr:large conductance mechanosensitive channel protein MscL [Microcella humidisoli]UTT61584.1 large conductance mechanosensitive channel protein MscL [Microcella humidisoli]
MLKGFREFILRGNVIDLAVAVVIGAAFTGVVNAIVTAVINPAIGALFNAATLEKALPVVIPTVSGDEAVLYFGAVIGAVLNFLIVAAVVYFALVAPVNHLRRRAEQRRLAGQPADEAAPPTELELLAEIRDLLAKRDAAPPAA